MAVLNKMEDLSFGDGTLDVQKNVRLAINAKVIVGGGVRRAITAAQQGFFRLAGGDKMKEEKGAEEKGSAKEEKR